VASNNTNKRQIIEGRAALVVIDIQASTFVEQPNEDRAIPHMPDYDVRMLRARKVIDKARACDIPVIFIQEIHRANLIDFGRELDGDETIHCLDNNPHTDLAKEQMGFKPNDFCVHYTFVDGHQGDYFCRVIEDCVAGSGIEAHNASLKAMEYLQSGAIRSIDEVMMAMDQTAQ